MSSVDTLIREIVREEIEAIHSTPADPVLLSIEDVKELCGGPDRSIIDNLVHESPANGFPAIRLSARVVRVDKARLLKWLAAGGLQKMDEKPRLRQVA